MEMPCGPRMKQMRNPVVHGENGPYQENVDRNQQGIEVQHLAMTEWMESISGAQAALPPGYALVPDLRGLSVRRAMNRLSTLQLDVDINGSGVVTAQSPAAGNQVKLGTRVSLQCQSPALPGLGT